MQNLKSFSLYLIAPALALLAFAIFFQIWKVDFALPIFSYGSDNLFGTFVVKTVIDSGWFFHNDFVGWPHFTETFYLHDFPLHADFFSFVIVKILACFSSNPFLIVNYFFIITIILAATTSFAVLRSFGISNFTAIIISVLYSLIPYHFARNTIHLFLSNYAVIPLVVMMALWIMSNQIQMIAVSKKNQYVFAPNRFFFMALVISFFAATNGIYYALYSCFVFVFAWFLQGLSSGKFFTQNLLVAGSFCLLIVVILLLLNMPSLIYWLQHGFNASVGDRDQYASEFFGLKIVRLFVPIDNHYIGYLVNVRNLFDRFTYEIESPAESLGIIGSAGFLFLLLWLVAKSFADEKQSFLHKTIQKFSLKKDDQNLISKLAGMNLLVVLFAASGGLVMMVVMSFPLLRSHARFSIFIAFIALFLIAIISDKIIAGKFFSTKNYARFFISIMAILALFDQVGKVSASTIQSEEMKNLFLSNQDFIERIEEIMPPEAMILEMPIINFPEGGTYDPMFGYLHSKNLRWSYPAMEDRESSRWQQQLMKLSFADFIAEIKKAGFSGVYIDRNLLATQKHSPSSYMISLEAHLKAIATEPPLVSKNKKLAFFKIYTK